ncbi:MAG: hypothetical protein ACJA10_001050 [Oleispira sp.]|jgi:hypothetical protein
MKTGDEKLNQLLNSVKSAAPNANLAQRIIVKARSQPDGEVVDMGEETFFKQFFHSFIFPKPVYALACSMLVGILLGWQNPEFNASTIPVTPVDNSFSSLFLAEVNFDE